jgi:hypothetical protein
MQKPTKTLLCDYLTCDKTASVQELKVDSLPHDDKVTKLVAALKLVGGDANIGSVADLQTELLDKLSAL